MEQNTNFEIEIISNETIKPSLPTPPHLKTFKLSLIDQIFPAFHIPLLLFYHNTQPNNLRVSALKSSLSITLSSFPPLSGRCTDDSTVSCTDEGIPFVEARVNCQLKQLIGDSKKPGFLQELLPPREFLAVGPRDISELVPLAFQFNVFECGGVVIGCYMLHKLLDASSLGTFFHHWAGHTSKRYEDLVEPDYSSIVKAFPPSGSIDRVIVPNLDSNSNSNSNSVVVLVKNFRISKTSITKLKTKAVSETQPNPTSFETIAGFIWKNVFSAACTSRATKHLPLPETTTLSLSINMRSRTNPKLPSHSMGNCITDVQAKSSTTSSTLPELVTEIHNAVTYSKAKIERFQGENGFEEICQDRKASSKFVMEDSECVYQVSSWTKSGFSEADFGFGKANVVVPTDGNVPVSLRNFVFFTDYWDFEGDGVDVWLFLEENELEVLGGNEKFLEYAFPN